MSESDAVPPSHPPVGIDLGTTYSVVAYLDVAGRPTTILNNSGDLLTPSAISFEDGEVVVGKEAVKSSVMEPGGFADCFKRDIGRQHFRRSIGQHEVPPEILSAFVLERLKQDAERRLGPIRKVVITVPAFFDELRRKATQEAGRLAGLEVLDIINEPTAAAVAFGYQQATIKGEPGAKQRVLVYDLGGGTFDVTVLEIDGRKFRTLATDGDVLLGGKDFDERLVNQLAERFLDAHGIDPRSDLRDAAQLWIDLQEAKHALSERQKTTVVCFHAGIRMRIEVTRSEFEELTRDLLERTEGTTQQVLRQAGLTWAGLDRILLVGGSSRMPMVSAMLERISGKPPDRSQSPDEAVAHGAALYAGMLMADGAQERKIELINVNSHSLGVVGIDPQTGRKANVILIPKNTPLPCRAARRFQTARDNQPNVKVPVVEGESQNPEHCIALGECIIRDLPNALPKGSAIEVEYRYAANGRISVSARVPNTRQSAHVEIQQQVRNLQDLATWRKLLLGAAAVALSASGGPDRATVMKELDDLLVRLAERCDGILLAEPLQKSRQLALTAIEEFQRAKIAVERADSARKAAVGGHEAAVSSSALSQARQILAQAETKARFARLALGRSCMEASFAPPGTEREMMEIRRLQEALKAIK